MELVAAKEAALYLGVAEGTLGHWRNASGGTLKWEYDAKGRPRYRRSELERWLREDKPGYKERAKAARRRFRG